MNLIDFKQLNNYDKLTWPQVEALKTLQRNMFPSELYWRENNECSGFTVSDKVECELRNEEMTLIMYSPEECSNGSIKNCEQLVTYTRIQITTNSQESAMLQFFTTIFTCIILTTFALLFQNDTQKIVITPITKMVSIIKTLADDPLQKPEPPKIDELEQILDKSNPNQMKTAELQKTIYRIGNLLQMSFGQLGAVIIRENVSSGDGSLEIMIPGHRINSIFLVVRINSFIEITEALKA